MCIKSFLYLSCLKLKDSSPEKLSKLEMDTILLDLEDSVPVHQREHARATLKKYFFDIKSRVPNIAVRINSLNTRDGIRDLNFITDNGLQFDVVLLSMVESEYEMEMARKILTEANINSEIYALIETPMAIRNVDKIASVSDGLFYGGADYCSQLGTKISKRNIQVDYVSSKIVNASKIYNIPAYDTPCFIMNNLDYLKKECEVGFVQGFNGKQAIHPQQLSIINQSYSYSTGHVAWATNVINAYESDGKGIIKASNVMIGPPFVKLARKILESD